MSAWSAVGLNGEDSGDVQRRRDPVALEFAPQRRRRRLHCRFGLTGVPNSTAAPAPACRHLCPRSRTEGNKEPAPFSAKCTPRRRRNMRSCAPDGEQAVGNTYERVKCRDQN